MKTIKRATVNVVVLLVLIILLAAVMKLPKTSKWDNNLITSFEEISKEGQYPRHLWASEQKWDNWTLAILLSVLRNIDERNVVTSVVHLYYQSGIEEDCFSEEAINDIRTVLSENVPLTDYSRYWMGNLIIMSLLLYIFPISIQRIFFGAVIVFLYIMLARRYKLSVEYIALLISTCMAFWPVNGMCLVYGIDIIISLIAILIYRVRSERNQFFDWIDYVMLGALTMFFCLLSNPLITLGMVLCLQVSDELAKNNCRKLNLAWRAVTCSLAWCAGYIVLMQLKGMMTEFIGGVATGEGRLLELIGSGGVVERTKTSIYLFMVFIAPWYGVCGVLGIVFLFCICRKAISFRKIVEQWPLLMIGLYPFIWEFVFYGHTGHGHEVNLYVITLFSSLIVFIKSIDFTRLRRTF